MVCSNFFPPPTTTETDDEDVSPSEQEQSTEPSELASQLPDAPTTDPQDAEDTQQPSLKRQKTGEAEDDFVVVDRDDAKEDKPKPEL